MFILIHGAYHGGWCWSRIVDRLADAGEKALAPDLPGHGRDKGWLADQTMENYVGRVGELLLAAENPVTLVGHSMGGATALLAAARHPDKVKRIVYLTAYIPAPGESVSDGVRADPESHAQTSRTEIGGIKAVSVKAESLGPDFYQDATERDLGWVQDRVQLQSPAPFRHVCEYDPAVLAGIPKIAIICTLDRAISPGHQRMMAERAGCNPILGIESGHSPFVTRPDELTEILLSLER